MARTKALTTVARELAKTYRPEQLEELSELVRQEAAKPRLDKRVYGRMQRQVRAAHAKKYQAEESLTMLLTEAGKTNDEITEEIENLRREGERDAVAPPAPKGTGRRGRPPKTSAE